MLRPNPQTKSTFRTDNASGLKMTLSYTNTTSNLTLGAYTMSTKSSCWKGHTWITWDFTYSNWRWTNISVVIGHYHKPAQLQIRHQGFSAWEILFKRDQFSGEQLNITNIKLASNQLKARLSGHEPSAIHKSSGGPPAQPADIKVGSVVYIKNEKDKTKARDRYLITDIKDNWCTVQKFTKSQLRAKRYELKLTEVYPATSEISDTAVPPFETASSSDDDYIDDDETVPAVPITVSIRPIRTRSKPAWMTSGDFELNANSEDDDESDETLNENCENEDEEEK